MFLLSLFLVLGVALLSAGRVPPPDQRIVCGFEEDIVSSPWQVYLHINSSSCGGVLYKDNIVLTAAHCMEGSKAADVSVYYGSSKWQLGQVTNVSEVIVHEDYNRTKNNGSFANDIAVLVLSSPIPLTTSAKTIDLASETPRAGSWALTTGWGQIVDSINGSYPETLKGTYVLIEDHESCRKAYDKKWACMQSNTTTVTNEMVCVHGKNQGPCRGDSGGPLVSVPDKQLIGITSWTVHCGHPFFPDVFTDVVVLKDWILSTVSRFNH
ncbi:trypsin alpha-like [Drosophila ficusphila]|uniref:trypsin alpha-like n=1 Tax=Drosophila ficusphila TaxID=30025 RepID=UPI0007E87DA6|nr:trypsin alpha-like [Drosophila ficusphila]